jgi:hypothetical protein
MPGRAKRRAARRILPWIALGAMATLYAVLAVASLRDESVTVDEFGHLPVGFNVLTTGDFGFCELNPPLMNILSALPLPGMGAVAPEARLSAADRYSFWGGGYRFMAANEKSYHRLYVAARCVTVAVVGMLGVLLFLWAGLFVPERRHQAGLLAAGLVWFLPGMMAHARLVTTDAGAAFFTALAVFGVHLFLRRPGVATGSGAGLVLGLAQLVKFSSIYLYPILALQTVLMWCRRTDRPPLRRAALLIALILCASLLTVHVGYLFQGSANTWSQHEPVSGALQSVKAILPGGLPVPVPAACFEAFDRQLRDAAAGDPAYLFGRSYHGGRWYFFPALLAIKTPIPLLLLAGWATLGAVGRRTASRDSAVMLLLPAVIFVAAFSILSNKQLSLRMILPAAPLFWLWTAVMLARMRWPRWRLVALLGLLAWSGVETARIHPHYLAYFNQLAGGPSQGYRYAVDSDLDWGQDLPGLKRYMDDRGLETIQLLYFGRVDPKIYGIDYTVPRTGLQPGLLAVSATLTTRAYFLWDHGAILPSPGPVRREGLGAPIAAIGHSIRIYRVPPRQGPGAPAG